MKTYPFLLLIVVVILLGSGCQHAGTPSLATQQKFFDSLTASNPEEEHALRCAQYHHLSGRFDLALEELSRAASSDPPSSRILNAMGNCYDKLGKYAQAREVYEKILAVNADNVPARNNLGYSCYLSGDLRRAEEIFQEILAKHPQDSVARNNLGLVWCRQGKESQALSLWQKTDGEIQAREKLAQVLASLGKSGKHSPGPDAHSPYQHTAALSDKACQSGQDRKTTMNSRDNLIPRNQLADLITEDLPAGIAPVSNPVRLTGKNNPRPQVEVEEVKMVVQPATYNRMSPEEPGEIDDWDQSDEVETPKRRHYYNRFAPQPRYQKAKIIDYHPLAQKNSQSIKKCLSNESLYRNQKSSGRQDFIF